MNYNKGQIREFKISLLNLNKKVRMVLVGLDGNAFHLMSVFRRKARRQGWEKHEIDCVLWKCRQKDYDYLLGILLEYTEPTEDCEDYEDVENW